MDERTVATNHVHAAITALARVVESAVVGGVTAAEAHRLGERGVVSPVEPGSWALALGAQRALLWGEAPLTVDAIGVGDPVASAHACIDMARLSIIQFDAVRASRWLDALETYASVPIVATWAPLGRAFGSWLATHEVDLERVGELSKSARSAGMASAVVEAQSLIALLALQRGQVELATQAARRASRMARTEGLVYAELLANVALARVRRFQGSPHLALRILSALAPHAPPPWQFWIAWESTLAGKVDHLEASVGWVREVASASPVLESDAAWVDALFDPASLDASGHPPSEAWQSGQSEAPPPGSAGLVFAARGSATSVAHVLVSAATTRRFPAALTDAVCARWEASPPDESAKPRLDVGLACLAFEREMPIERYFETVYGYAFEKELHWSVLNTHVHRLRAHAPDGVEVERGETAIRVAVTRAVVLRDPRSRETLEDRALRVLAHEGPLSARELAQRLEMPLRTVQRTVGELVEGETLRSSREGRVVRYAVEDTTFSEATESRVFRAPE